MAPRPWVVPWELDLNWADRNAESQVGWDLTEKLQLPGGSLYTVEQGGRAYDVRLDQGNRFS